MEFKISTTSSVIGINIVIVMFVGLVVLCVHKKSTKVASATRVRKRHLRAGENYNGKHRIASNRSIISSVVSSNEDLTSYYEVYQIVVPTMDSKTCHVAEQTEVFINAENQIKLSDQ
ncbi:uncharacterized protein LOC133200741 [Saccostrea echinata]|uniref:uncharacterized protein LOC133200741 n=1 Tax=Saccostrea echinata TaxID=191078 RepID=UPI002A7F9624|nr:uncharacterized protein LOC133200741 [Saccostrea echinata]